VNGTCKSRNAFRKGTILSYSCKQKVKTKSSRETEIVRVDFTVMKILQSLYFMHMQGCGAKSILIYQDNKSANLLESNGEIPSSKQVKHINAKKLSLTR
jgi:hypothetical protein